MMKVLERFLRYTAFDTRSDEATGKHPSTPGQRYFAESLAGELRELGLQEIRITKYGHLVAALPPTPGYEDAPVLGLIAHLDTAGEASGANIRPQVVERYAGGILALGQSGKMLDPAIFPVLNRLHGHTLVTTDGTTLLGADDKAGIAEIITAVAEIIAAGVPHGAIRLAFTPDEEIGEGARYFDVAGFGADYAYTVDGGAAGEIEFQNFHAAEATFAIRGRSVHPGTARGVMRNAIKIAGELQALFPPEEAPEHTDGFDGFYHPVRLAGGVGEAELVVLLRDHDRARFETRKEFCRTAAETLNRRYGPGAVAVAIRDQYANMEEVIRRHPELIEIAEQAIREAGLEPVSPPIRGGTDGAMLSFRGLPCPNLGTGGYNFHGEYEFASVQEMAACVRILRGIIVAFGELRKGGPQR